MPDNADSDQDDDTLPRRVSAEDLAELFDCTSRTVRSYAKRGIVKRSRVHGQYYLLESVKGFLMFRASGKDPTERAAIDAELDEFDKAARLYGPQPSPKTEDLF